MRQRTCNIINCCKLNCGLPLPAAGRAGPAWAGMVAAYMSKECGCPAEDYEGRLLEQVMSEALLDYMDGADAPGSDLRRLFGWPGMGPEPGMCDRIASVLSMVTVRGKDGAPVNGFTEELIARSRLDLACPDAMERNDKKEAAE